MNKACVFLRCMAGMISLSCLLAAGSCQRQDAPSAGLSSVNTDVSQMDSLVSEQPQVSSEAPAVTSVENLVSEEDAVSSAVSVAASESSSSNGEVSSLVEPSHTESDTAETTASIPFSAVYKSVGAYRPIGEEERRGPDYSSATLVTSMAELIEVYEQERWYEPYPDDYDYTRQYNEAFFTEKALIVIVRNYSHSSDKTRIDTVTRANQKLIVDYTTIIPVIREDAEASWRILVEVSKEDIGEISDVVLQQHVEKMDWLSE